MKKANLYCIDTFLPQVLNIMHKSSFIIRDKGNIKEYVISLST